MHHSSITYMTRLFVMSIAIFPSLACTGEVLPKDISKKLSAYNVIWDSPSTSGSMESMPIGNGDITSNIWVEKNGDLMLYIGKSDSWSEGTRLLKLGRLRISLTPNPFATGAQFKETLDLHKGLIDISTGEKGSEVNIKIWIDANNPVGHIDINSAKSLSLTCTTELLRPQPFVLTSGADPIAGSFRGVVDGPVRPTESADTLLSRKDAIVWAHRNDISMYPLILKHQNVEHLIDKYPDPYKNLTFGALVSAKGMEATNDSTITSISPAKKWDLSFYGLTAQTPSLTDWEKQLTELSTKIGNEDPATGLRKHEAWWDNFWNRSWIFISGDEDAEKVTRAYLLQRYLMACQSRGKYPVKFNGGNLTFDYNGLNGDYRRWGPGYWHQNCRLYYWPLAASGDFDLKKPWFDMYINALPLQSDITREYYGHDGAFYPETMNFFGMYIQDDWGWNNPGKASQTRWIRYHYNGALELLAEMIDMYEYTRDEEFAKHYIVPFATQVIKFFMNHWTQIDNKYSFIPSNSLEQFWDCLNPIDYIAGLTYDIDLLKKFPSHIIGPELRAEWDKCLSLLPAIPMTPDKNRLLPAEEYGEPRNFENPECYAIFPYKLYGITKPNFEVALNTFNARKFNQSTCWSQDPIQAPLLGLTELSKECLLKNIAALDSAVRFPVFWKPGSDYIPDLDNGGAFAMGLQQMLLQDADGKILILPAFPKEWDVDFKLHAHDRTTVRVRKKGSKIEKIDVIPSIRTTDLQF